MRIGVAVRVVGEVNWPDHAMRAWVNAWDFDPLLVADFTISKDGREIELTRKVSAESEEAIKTVKIGTRSEFEKGVGEFIKLAAEAGEELEEVRNIRVEAYILSEPPY